ncbi:MAG: DNA alkylation repair protein [Sediminibacterium sp.]|nr:DNA alkylation repair protein [Sediminibacterium sp.]
MHPYIAPIQNQFTANANTLNAKGMKAYMLNQFDFWGIKTPLRDSIVHQYLKENKITKTTELEKVVKELWKMDEREMQYAAIDVFKAHQLLWKPSSIKMIQYCLTHKSWWDTVDSIASDWLGRYFNLFPEQTLPISSAWNKSDNMWLQRSSILFQKSYKTKTNTGLLSKYILTHKKSKEFFIQKAIGWALREYSKTNPEWVKSFVEIHDLAPLSKREALKRINI